MSKHYEFTSVRLGYTFTKPHKQDSLGFQHNCGFVLQWACKEVGFGELVFSRKGSKTMCENEGMPRAFIDAALKYWLDSMVYLEV